MQLASEMGWGEGGERRTGGGAEGSLMGCGICLTVSELNRILGHSVGFGELGVCAK